MLSTVSKTTDPVHTSQFELVKYPDSLRVNDLAIEKEIPATLYDNLLNFRGTDKTFELGGNLLKMITTKNYNVDQANLPDRNLLFDFRRIVF